MARKYELKKRAEKQEETRRRIARAAVELHAEQGPVATSLKAVAERAGVQRHTLYRHFPDERDLALACSGLHFEENPMPSAGGWWEIEDPLERTRHGLGELFAYWEANEPLMSHVARDSEVDAVTREVGELRTREPLGAMREALLAAWSPGRRPGKRLSAAVDLALDFRTWDSLVRRSGLSRREAAAVAATAIEAVATAGRAPAPV